MHGAQIARVTGIATPHVTAGSFDDEYRTSRLGGCNGGA